jgi:hypothetical protein
MEDMQMNDMTGIDQFIQAEVKRQLEKAQLGLGGRPNFTTGRYGEVRKKYRDIFRDEKFDCGFFTHKILDAIKEIAKADAGVSYMSKATEEDFEKMADVFEVMAEAYLNYKKSHHSNNESEER